MREFFRGIRLLRQVTSPSKMNDFLKRNPEKAVSYESTIAALNNLQSNAEVLKNAVKETRPASVSRTLYYLNSLGITPEQLSKLSVIHISGTKGKGSTGAFTESILRHNGYRTGFFSSPHLLQVRERIRINGLPLPENLFVDYFWKVYNELNEETDPTITMPPYFMFLTVLAFHVFLAEKVDVVILEVGIGGQYDCTNVVSNVSVVGITSLGLDHTGILGTTIESIAWHKAGIMKPTAIAYTVPGHIPSVLDVLRERSFELGCPLRVAPLLENYIIPDQSTKTALLNLEFVQRINASLALQLSNAWMERHNNIMNRQTTRDSLQLKDAKPFTVEGNMSRGILECFWPGRMQVFRPSNSKITYFLDGAHTLESITACIEWFRKNSSQSPGKKKALLYYMTGLRDCKKNMEPLFSYHFDKVIFTPNVLGEEINNRDNKEVRSTDESQRERCELLLNAWNSKEIQVDGEKLENMAEDNNSCITKNISEAIWLLVASDVEWDVLVTGSLHLVGNVLTILKYEM